MYSYIGYSDGFVILLDVDINEIKHPRVEFIIQTRRVYEAELEGVVTIHNGIVRLQ